VRRGRLGKALGLRRVPRWRSAFLWDVDEELLDCSGVFVAVSDLSTTPRRCAAPFVFVGRCGAHGVADADRGWRVGNGRAGRRC